MKTLIRSIAQAPLVTLSLASLAGMTACDGCNRHKVPDFVDANVPPPPPPPTASADLPVLVDDAGADASDAAPDAAAKSGARFDTNQIRARRCCKALENAVAALPNSTEKAQMQGVAATCTTIANGLGRTPGGSPTELEPLRQLLKGRAVPDVCRGL